MKPEHDHGTYDWRQARQAEAAAVHTNPTSCRYCNRPIVNDPEDGWVDPEATGDDIVWRETCDAHDTFVADHEPAP